MKIAAHSCVNVNVIYVRLLCRTCRNHHGIFIKFFPYSFIAVALCSFIRETISAIQHTHTQRHRPCYFIAECRMKNSNSLHRHTLVSLCIFAFLYHDCLIGTLIATYSRTHIYNRHRNTKKIKVCLNGDLCEYGLLYKFMYVSYGCFAFFCQQHRNGITNLVRCLSTCS